MYKVDQESCCSPPHAVCVPRISISEIFRNVQNARESASGAWARRRQSESNKISLVAAVGVCRRQRCNHCSAPARDRATAFDGSG